LAKRRKSSANWKGQPYDTTLKTWIKENPQEILPILLPGAIFQEAIDIERIKPTMRTDRVFKALYRGALHILNIELETGSDGNMPTTPCSTWSMDCRLSLLLSTPFGQQWQNRH
jgi:hypothetical protein